MKLLILVSLLLAPGYAAVCNHVSSCNDCNSIFDSEGSQSCSWCVGTRSCVAKSGLECIFSSRISDKRDCPLQIKQGFSYNETFARSIMVPLSGAAYGNDPQKCLTNALHGAKLVRQLTMRCDSAASDLCSGFTAVSDYHKAIILSFRGSAGFMQLLLEAAESLFSKKMAVPGGGMASKYFYDAFNAIWSNGMKDDLLRAKVAYPNYEVWITGHSLGGSMAAIAANVIVSSKMYPGEKIKLVTFGEPRTGDRNFAASHDQLLPYTYRVTHKMDLVPHLPTEDFEGYHHHRYEVWYNNGMKRGDPHVVCLEPEGDSCSDSNLIDLSVDNHLHYFDTDISGIGRDGCVHMP